MSDIGAEQHQQSIPPLAVEALGEGGPLGEEERRESVRIPLDVPVRLGKPNNAPYATVSARNLSTKGLFIDADRPVRVGARFSVEIPYGHGEPVYVDEAEVAYNRKSAHGAGFGVRFTELSEQAEERLNEIVERAVEPTMVVRRSTVVDNEDVEEAPTLVSEPIELSEISLSSYPEPEIVDDNLELAEVLQSDFQAPQKGVKGLVQDVRYRFVNKVQTGPGVWAMLMGIGGLALISAIAVSLWSSARADAGPPARASAIRGVQASTHEVLMGEREAGSLVPEPAQPEAPAEAKRPLPPLVVLEEEPATKAQSKEIAAHLLGTKTERKAPKAAAKPKRAVKKVAKKAAAKPAKRAATKRPKARPTERPTAKAAAPGSIAMQLMPGASVLKTHVLRKPDRFVIDLVGQTKLPSAPQATGHIQKVRVGMHPGKVRIVLDTDRAIEAGRVSQQGTKLRVQLHYK